MLITPSSGIRSRPCLVLAASLAAVLLVGTACVGASAPVDVEPSRLQSDLDALIAHGITGAQARAIAPDDTSEIATSGTADLESRRPVSADAHFRMGSTTKTYTATVVLQLVGEGKLSLDDRVERWLPGVVQGSGNDGRRISIRNLLQHTSGISDNAYPMPQSAEEYYRTRFSPVPPEEIVQRAMQQPPLFPPGAGWSYANTGYVILGMVIERVTGRPWYEEVNTRIIEPLGLTGTRWPCGDPRLPEHHSRAYKRFEADEPLVDVTDLVNVDASGGLITTTEDLNRFLRALLGGRLLRPSELNQMKRTVPTDQSVQFAFPGASYGLGIMNIPLTCGGSYWSNSGSDPGWGNDNGVTDDGRRSVVSSWSTEDVTDPELARAQAKAFVNLTNNALCAAP